MPSTLLWLFFKPKVGMLLPTTGAAFAFHQLVEVAAILIVFLIKTAIHFLMER